MTRGDLTYNNLNGLWEFQLGDGFNEPVPFGKTLNQTILVPFPLEACLSGAFQWPLYSKFLWYRLLFDAPCTLGDTLLHFGAVDWNTTVYFNGANIGNHLGGYDAFSFDITNALKPTNNELIVAVYDPSDDGYQVNGKQRISAIPSPGGDTYTPSSGIWQTVWTECVPPARITGLRFDADLTTLYLNVSANAAGNVNGTVSFAGAVVTTFSGSANSQFDVPIPSPQLWHPNTPNLYDLSVTFAGVDTVGSYFGMRTFTLANFTSPPTPATGPRIGMDNSGGDMPNQPTVLPQSDYSLCWALCNTTAGCMGWSYGVNGTGCESQPLCWLKANPGSWGANPCRIAGNQALPGGLAVRPVINGGFQFLAGFLDQSWWPDGEYTAPTDDALLFDLQVVKQFGLNAIRLHQKVNPQRWYLHADTVGVVILQDMIQKYGGASAATIPDFMLEIQAMMDTTHNHPSVVQYTVFNEGDCIGAFSNVSEIVSWVQASEPTRLVDTNSGGPGNDLHVGDVNDIHSYPWPGSPSPSATQYAMVGEFGGVGTYQTGQHEWANGQCGTYLHENTAQEYADTYAAMATNLLGFKAAPGVSVSIYTQTTDLENECDGMVNMDRTAKFNASQIAEIKAANDLLTSTGR